MKAMLLAAGRGERMRPLSDTLPKPLLEAGGKPLIVWQLEALARAGVRECVVNTAWLAERLHERLGDGSAWGLRIHWQDEPGQAWETGGGIASALPLLGDAPFVVASADIHTGFDYARLHAAAARMARDPQACCAHFVLVDNPPHHPGGDMALAADGRVMREGERLNYGNIGVFHPAMFAGTQQRARWKLFPWAYQFVEAGRVTGEHQLPVCNGHRRDRWSLYPSSC